MTVSTSKVWVGPLLLVLLIALIYVFSLLPHSHKESYVYDFQEVEVNPYPANRGYPDLDSQIKLRFHLHAECNRRGTLMEKDGQFVCSCISARGKPLYWGAHCEKPNCLNNGTLEDDTCNCPGPFMGDRCEHQCIGIYNKNGTTVTCDCPDRYFGKYCEYFCNVQTASWNRETQKCTCKEEGAEPPHCSEPCLRPECLVPPINHKKGVVNSRLTLSGLSFCLITIGLLCITARRRRLSAQALPNSEETWYRIFQPQAAGRRCRHDFVCGGSWIPRDRALLVGAPSRPPTQARLARNNRSLTPPPSYCSVENLDGSSGAPPTYEEAIHRNPDTSPGQEMTEIEADDKDPQSPTVTQVNEENPASNGEERDPNANTTTTVSRE